MEDETKEKYMVKGKKNKKVHKKKGELCNVINQLPMSPSGGKWSNKNYIKLHSSLNLFKVS